MRYVLASLVLVALGACEFEAADNPPPPDEPTMLGDAGTQPACPAPDPDFCVAGYTKEVSPDGARVFCVPSGCYLARNPCKRGMPYGDPSVVVLCDGVSP